MENSVAKKTEVQINAVVKTDKTPEDFLSDFLSWIESMNVEITTAATTIFDVNNQLIIGDKTQ